MAGGMPLSSKFCVVVSDHKVDQLAGNAILLSEKELIPGPSFPIFFCQETDLKKSHTKAQREFFQKRYMGLEIFVVTISLCTIGEWIRNPPPRGLLPCLGFSEHPTALIYKQNTVVLNIDARVKTGKAPPGYRASIWQIQPDGGHPMPLSSPLSNM